MAGASCIGSEPGRAGERGGCTGWWPVQCCRCCVTRQQIACHCLPLTAPACSIKSPNVLVDDQWRGKLADFNLSAVLNQQTSSTPIPSNPTWLASDAICCCREL